MNANKTVLVPLVLTLSLSGCASIERLFTFNNESEKPAIVIHKKTPELVQLEKDLDVFSDEIRAISEARHVAKGSIKRIKVQPNGGDHRLTKLVTINRWYGEASPLLERLARGHKYSYKEIGIPPTHPKLISIDVENEKVIDVYFEIGMQLGSYANLTIDEVSSSIVLMHQTE